VRNHEAKKFSRMNYAQLIDLAGKNDLRKAGTHFVFDFLACKLIARSSIEAHFVHGKNLLDVRKAIEGRPHGGTVVNDLGARPSRARSPAGAHKAFAHPKSSVK
jgi:uridylate kinase